VSQQHPRDGVENEACTDLPQGINKSPIEKGLVPKVMTSFVRENMGVSVNKIGVSPPIPMVLWDPISPKMGLQFAPFSDPNRNLSAWEHCPAL
jgi:hypothetical protein